MSKIEQARETFPQAPQQAQQPTTATSSTPPTPPAAAASSNEPLYEPLETDFSEPAAQERVRVDESGPTYTDLGSEGGSSVGTGYPGNVTPFTDEEVFDGTLQSVLYGYQVAGFRWRSEQEIATFTQNFTKPPMSPVAMPTFISKLGVGEALARYGIGHGMAVENVLNRAADLPPWVTLVIYGGLTFGASYLGMEQVKRARQAEANFMDGGRSGGTPGPDVGVQEERYAA